MEINHSSSPAQRSTTTTTKKPPPNFIPRSKWAASELESIPPDWTITRHKRGASALGGKNKGSSYYKHYHGPLGHRFRSMKQVHEFLLLPEGSRPAPPSQKNCRGGSASPKKSSSGSARSRSSRARPRKYTGGQDFAETFESDDERDLTPASLAATRDPPPASPKGKPRGLGKKKRETIADFYIPKTLLPLTKTGAIDTSSGRFQKESTLLSSAPDSASDSPNPSSQHGLAIGCKIWVVDVPDSAAKLKRARGKNPKPHQHLEMYEGRVVDVTGSGMMQVRCEVEGGGGGKEYVTEHVHATASPYLLARNVVWSRFQKHPWWPAMTLLPSPAMVKVRRHGGKRERRE